MRTLVKLFQLSLRITDMDALPDKDVRTWKSSKPCDKIILCSNKSYRDRLINLKLLPLCRYAKLHDILYLLAIMRGEYDNTFLRSTRKPPEATRQDTRGEFKIPKSCLQKTDNFFRRLKSLYNLVIRVYKDYVQYLNKITLLRIYYKFFEKSFTENYKCTQRIFCRCGHCNPLNKKTEPYKLTLKHGWKPLNTYSRALSTTTTIMWILTTLFCSTNFYSATATTTKSK